MNNPTSEPTASKWEQQFDSAILWAREPNKADLKALKESYQEVIEALETLCNEIRFLIDEGTLPQDAHNHASVLRAKQALAHATGGQP